MEILFAPSGLSIAVIHQEIGEGNQSTLRPQATISLICLLRLVKKRRAGTQSPLRPDNEPMVARISYHLCDSGQTSSVKLK
jgi:hypothetical protein